MNHIKTIHTPIRPTTIAASAAFLWLIAVAIASTSWAQAVPAMSPVQVTSVNSQSTYAKSFVLNQRTNVATLPTGKAATKGFTATIEVTESKLPGYVPLKVRLQSNTTFTSDRQLSLRVTPITGGHSPPMNLFSATIPLEIDQGTSLSSSTHYIPRWSVGNAYRLELFENNQALDEYETEIGDLNLKYAGIPSQALLSESDGQWAYIQGSVNDIPADVREICAAVSGQSLMSLPQPSADPWYWSNIEAAGYYRSVPISNLPHDWRGYQSLDAALISTAVLENLRQNQPVQFGALRDWLFCGGTIVLTDTADIAAIEQLLNIKSTDFNEDNVVSQNFGMIADGRLEEVREAMKHALNYVSSGQFGQGTPGYVPNLVPGWQGTGPSVAFVQSLPAPKDLRKRLVSDLRGFEKLSQRTEAQWRETLCVMNAAAGRIIGIAKEDDAELPRLAQWQFANELIGIRKSTMLRRGVDPILGDSRARRWLIPGVSEPPVYTFMGLLGLFVILVGPVAYRRTTQQGRSHLMFAIAPALALATTAAMFGYGIIADGFGTSVRVRQLTWVDGVSGDASERVRATYFAGIRPGDGMRFPADSEVFHYRDPLGQSWEALHGKSAVVSGRVTLRDTEQRFDSSFLPSREQQQFVFHRPRNDIGNLSFVNNALTSTFDVDLHEVIVCGADGQYWIAENVPANGVNVKCELMEKREASKRLGDMYLKHRPVSLVIDGNDQTRRSSRYRNQTQDLMTGTLRKLNMVGTANAQEGLFEQKLQQWLQTDGSLPTDNFVALAEVSEDVVSVEDAELVESVHYLFGTLKP